MTRFWHGSAAAISALTLTAIPPVEAGEPADSPITAQTMRSGGQQPAEQAALRLRHLDLSIAVTPEAKGMSGVAELTLEVQRPVSRLLLDLDTNLAVSAVRIDGTELAAGRWRNPDGRLTIDLPARTTAGQTIKAYIVYAGTPHIAANPPWDDGWVWARSPDGQPWIATTAQGYGCDLIWPCIDHPSGEVADADIRITVPSPLVALSNGRAMGMAQATGGARTFHWRSGPINPYLITINIGAYAELKGDYASRFGNRVPLHYWHLGRTAEAKSLFAEFAPTLDFFESVIGPFPFADQKLGVVQTPYLGMEHQTLNGYGNDYKPSAEGFDWLFHHELSHEWFGNQMTAADWDDFWLHEGYGQYMQPLYGRWREGEARYAAMMAEQRLRIANKSPIVSGRTRTAEEVYEAKLGGPGVDIYFKGSWVLHTLRGLIGDTAFFDATRRLVYGRPDPRPGNFAPRFATTAEFERLMTEASGQRLDWFFDVYLRQAALPRLIEQRSASGLCLTWKAPGGRPFPLPVEVSVDGVVQRVAMTGDTGFVPAPAGAHLIVDPNARVLRQSDAIDRVQAGAMAQ
ncbi:M1 family metallopeptidase [Sphingomonas sp. FW199]|uniref:M1 family metallopeptidase n=1 Tax=Sphingomonas sp. FW199 TaxID=3400217 RepID=UPI003CEE8FA7